MRFSNTESAAAPTLVRFCRQTHGRAAQSGKRPRMSGRTRAAIFKGLGGYFGPLWEPRPQTDISAEMPTPMSKFRRR